MFEQRVGDRIGGGAMASRCDQTPGQQRFGHGPTQRIRLRFGLENGQYGPPHPKRDHASQNLGLVGFGDHVEGRSQLPQTPPDQRPGV